MGKARSLPWGSTREPALPEYVRLVRWLYVDQHYVVCHLRRALLSYNLRRNVINVNTNVDCR